jgi:Ca2+-binding EF-hand superfamily protein
MFYLGEMTLVTDPERIRAVFKKYSPDSSSLTCKQYKVAALAISGYKPSKSMVERLYRDLDLGDTMDIDTFTRIQLEQAKLRSTSETLKQIFQSFDRSCNGFISKSDFLRAVKEVLPSYSNAESLFDKADWDQDGRISWRDFLSLMGIS